MNQAASSAAASPDAVGAQLRPSGTAAWAWRIGVYAGSTLFAIVWSFLAGKDLNWDALNYHLYSGYSVAHDRFGTDFLAAGPQSYFSPYAHVPLYAMVMAHWSSLTIGTVLAAAHSINLWLTYELALRVVPRRGFRPAHGVAVLAVILAALNPVLLQTMGSSYVDITTGAVALAGWVVLAAMFERPTTKGMVLAGVLLGVATALKMSNAVFAIAGVAVVLCLPGALSARLRWAAIYGLACALAFGATYGAWGLRLWQEFHNPFFPFFNGLFGSPEFTTEPLKQTRFTPASLGAALWRPIEMAFALPMVHVEPQSPDVRYVEWMLVASVALVVALRSRLGFAATAGGTPADTPGPVAPRTALLGVTVGFLVAWTLWLVVSGNSRYFLPMGCVLGVLIAATLRWLLPGKRMLLAAVALALVAPQAWLILTSTWTRWAKLDWSGPWFGVSIPERYQREPFLYLGVDPHTGSFLLPFLAEGSAMMSISGQQALTPEAPGGQRAVALLAKHAGRIRIIDWVGRISSDGSPLPASAEDYNGRLRPFGLKIDRFDCGYILLHGGPRPQVVQIPGGPVLRELPPTHMLTCGVIPSNEDLTAYREELRQVDRVLDRVEDVCPELFSPRRMPTQQFNGFWRRVYFNSEVLAWVIDGKVRYRATLPGADSIELGTVDEWTRGMPAVSCGKQVYRFRDGAAVGPK